LADFGRHQLRAILAQVFSLLVAYATQVSVALPLPKGNPTGTGEALMKRQGLTFLPTPLASFLSQRRECGSLAWRIFCDSDSEPIAVRPYHTVCLANKSLWVNGLVASLDFSIGSCFGSKINPSNSYPQFGTIGVKSVEGAKWTWSSVENMFGCCPSRWVAGARANAVKREWPAESIRLAATAL